MSKEFNHGKITPINVSSEMKTSFLDYAMSVIVARALPDVRDGLKPVHRRILYAMNDLGIHSDKPFKKSARIAGEVIGKYHPHGEAAVYDTMVRMAQDFSYRYMLVDGHGNFGSIDGDGAAAMRYTEARLSKLSMEMMKDINKETIDFVDNYDGEEQEPVVLPARFPNLLVNGSTGIAVGMATNIPPHNLREVINGLFALMDNPDITILELMEIIPGPDFPTGGQILGRSGIKQAYETGRGSVVVRGKTSIEDIEHGKKLIVITEIPFQVNKANMVERIAQLVRDKAVEGITDLRDLSNREGIRIEIELKRDIQAEVILNQLFRMCQLQTSFGINMLSLVNNTPKQLNIKEMLNYYLAHQVDVTLRRTQFDLTKALERAHILEGLRIALDHIDQIITIIRSSKDDNETIARFYEEFQLTEIQSKAILDMRLRRLTGLERDKIEDEYNKLIVLIADLKDILSNNQRVLDIIRNELTEVRERFGDDRRTEILEEMLDMMDEDLIPVSDIVVSLSVNGYIKRLAVDSYRAQNRGGRGVKGMALNIDDIVDQIISCSTHEDIMFFTNLGRVFRIRGYMVPEGSRISKGIPVVNMLKLEREEKVSNILSIPKDVESAYLFFATRNGLVKRTRMDEFNSIRQSGKIAIGLNDNDELISVKLTNGEDEIIIAGSNGKAVRFNEQDVRPMGRNASGVKGFNTDGAAVIGMCTSREGSYILSVTANGYGKKTPITEYRLTTRGAKGVKTINTTDKNGDLVTIKVVSGEEDIIIISTGGIVIRTAVEGISSQGRNAQGVKLIALDGDTTVSNVAIVEKTEADETDIDGIAQP